MTDPRPVPDPARCPAPDCERLLWQSYADACVEHDDAHARRAAAELERLLLTASGR